ncbi:MAG: hypothetical protein V3R73_01400, partial [Sphingomonadales bacterium]
MWLEMAKDGNHGGKGWEFGRCLWTPTATAKGGRRADWNLLLKVRLGDPVIHLRGKGDKAAFVGVSTAKHGGWQTSRRPPEPGAWGYAQKYQEFHLVELTGYKPLPEPIPLEECFAASRDALEEYYSDHRKKGRGGKTLFFEIRKGRLQCRSRAYLSELSSDLQEILWGPLVNLSKGTGKRSAQLARKEDALRRLLDQKDLAWRACEICRILPVNQSWQEVENSKSDKDRIRDARARLEGLKLGDSWPEMDRKLERCPLCFSFYLGWSEQDHSCFMGESDHYFQRITQESAMHELTSLNSKQARRWLAQSGIDDPIPGLLKMLEAAKPAEAATTLARHYQQQSDWKAFEALLGH